MHFAKKKKRRGKICGRVGVVFFWLYFILLLSEDGTAAIIVKTGPFNLDDPKDYSVDVRISDGGAPVQTSITKLAIKVCLWATIASQSTREPHVLISVPPFAVLPMRRQADCHAVQSRRPSDGSERPRPDIHPALHSDHTGWVWSCLFFFPVLLSIASSRHLGLHLL